ncbi:MAG: hypothetical protein Q8P18_09780 [Pseudomonadota bacterium]|nr:hypothetical protein [Pseudomonadota bacterium]
MTFVDVSIDYPMLATERLVVEEEAPSGGPITGALVVDAGFGHFNSVDLVMTGAVRGWGANWDRTPGFTARVWDVGLDFGARFVPGPDDAMVQGWWGVGSGVRVGVLDVDWWEDVASFGIGGWTGGGLVIGRGDVRAVVSVRGDVSIRADSWTGTVMTSGQTTTWSYWPGNARVSALAGVELR